MQESQLMWIKPDMAVYDREGHTLGTVSHVYRHSLVAAGDNAGLWHADDRIEVSTGLLGLGRHLFIPLDAIADVTHESLVVKQSKHEIDDLGWDTKPTALAEER
jgi:hypothetical protein